MWKWPEIRSPRLQSLLLEAVLLLHEETLLKISSIFGHFLVSCNSILVQFYTYVLLMGIVWEFMPPIARCICLSCRGFLFFFSSFSSLTVLISNINFTKLSIIVSDPNSSLNILSFVFMEESLVSVGKKTLNFKLLNKIQGDYDFIYKTLYNFLFLKR